MVGWVSATVSPPKRTRCKHEFASIRTHRKVAHRAVKAIWPAGPMRPDSFQIFEYLRLSLPVVASKQVEGVDYLNQPRPEGWMRAHLLSRTIFSWQREQVEMRICHEGVHKQSNLGLV